jgi:hypothetical protein
MPATRVLKIGADPEFEIRDSEGTFISADDLISHPDGRFGCDGCSCTGEIRPGPGTPEIVERNISTILDSGLRTLRNHYMYSGAGKHVSLGGHIHFSGVEPDRKLISSLDKLITEPLRLASNYEFRERTGYGNNGAWDSKNHGWEYRAPCSWISHPYIARGVLEISYWCAEYFNLSGNTFVSYEKLIEYVSTKSQQSAEKIKLFYVTIEKLHSHHLKLEDVEIFQAWRKRPLPAKQEGENLTKYCDVTFTYADDDFNMNEIMNSVNSKTIFQNPFQQVSLRIIGANSNRAPGVKSIFMNNANKDKFPTTICGIPILCWNKRKIGLSRSLREDTNKSVDVVNKLRWHLENFAKIRINDLCKSTQNPIYVIEE